MSLGVGSVALASTSSDRLRESLLDDIGMASVWSSAPPMDGSTSSGDTSNPVSRSPRTQKQTLPNETTEIDLIVWILPLLRLISYSTVDSMLVTSSAGLDEEKFRFALQWRTMLAIEVVCDELNWDMLSVHAVHGTREAVVTHLKT